MNEAVYFMCSYSDITSCTSLLLTICIQQKWKSSYLHEITNDE